MDQHLPTIVPADTTMPCCCARCGAAFDARTQEQLKTLQRFAALGMALAEAVVAFPLRTRHLDPIDTQHFELLGRGARRCIALENKVTEDARKRHDREAHGAPAPAPAPRDHEPSERAPKPLPPLTAEDEESVIGPDLVVTDRAEDLLTDTREQLLDRSVDDHTPAVVATAIARDLETVAVARGLTPRKEDLTVFLEPVPTRATLMESAAADWPAATDGAPQARDTAEPRPADPGTAEPGQLTACPPVAKGRDPP